MQGDSSSVHVTYRVQLNQPPPQPNVMTASSWPSESKLQSEKNEDEDEDKNEKFRPLYRCQKKCQKIFFGNGRRTTAGNQISS